MLVCPSSSRGKQAESLTVAAERPRRVPVPVAVRLDPVRSLINPGDGVPDGALDTILNGKAFVDNTRQIVLIFSALPIVMMM